ncbi:hypothetical protein ACJMK2_003682 [Sinanodonta woodiana]|uniref:C2H2-type domain-containing protein n=1 Tax=Sinanodonta woodiana TaxID=1069815 RepID=A0ABD3Y0W8_SINWO
MTTRLITVKSLTNTRGRAYRCRKGPAEVAIVGEKSKVVSHIYKKHTALDQSPFYCSLCTFRCQYQRDLERHVRYYSAHREKDNQLREMGCPVNEEAKTCIHTFQATRERSRQGEISSQLSTMCENVQEDHELGTIITLAHPAAPMMLAEAERSSSRNDNSSAQSEVQFLDELLDCGSPINFYHTPISLSTMVRNSTFVQQRKAHHRQPPRNTEPKDAFKLAEQPNVIAVEGHQQLGKLVDEIDTLKDIMEKQVHMLRKNNTQSTSLMVNFTAAIQEQTNTYRSLYNNITTMIEHLNDTKKPHPREDWCKNQIGEERDQDKNMGGHQDRRDRDQDKNETVRNYQRENRRERSPMRYKHRHSPY